MPYIKNIFIENFKSHKLFKTSNNKKNIVLLGPNGTGKTNVLDALLFFSSSKSIRGEKIEKIFPIEAKSSHKVKVHLEIENNNQFYKLRYEISKNENSIRREFFVDDQRAKSSSAISDIVIFLMISPYMDRIMQDGSSAQIKFFDKMISFYNKNFYNLKKDYAKLNTERFSLLKNENDPNWLNALEKKIANCIYEIFKERREYIKMFNSYSKNKFSFFKKIQIKFDEEITNLVDKKDHALKYIADKLAQNRPIDHINHKNNFGINSDTISIFDLDKNITTPYLSTGEQKGVLFSIFLTNFQILQDSGLKIILLFDEVGSHFDLINIEKFFREIEKFDTQIWYTGTDKKTFQTIENKAFFVSFS